MRGSCCIIRYPMRAMFQFAVVLFLVGVATGDPSFRVRDQSVLEINWNSIRGKQYQVLSSSDLVNWSPLGARRLGVDGSLTVEHDISGRERGFYRVEECPDFALDLSQFNFGRTGSRWSYDVVISGISGNERYIWDSEIGGRTTFRGEEVVEWIFYRDRVWDQTIYILDDFSDGVYEVGGIAAGQGEQWNDPALPSLLRTFNPGEVTAYNYQSSVLGNVSDRITITPQSAALTVPAGTFNDVIMVEHRYNGVVEGGFAVTGLTTEWFVPGIGLIRHVGEINLAGFVGTTEYTLRSYELE